MLSLRVIFFRFLFIALFFVSFSLLGQESGGRVSRSQVLDDSTKNIYGPKTTRFFYEENIFFSDYTASTLDTVIHDFHLYNFVQRYNYEYQDLGNIGTAMNPLYYQLPTQIGVSSGWTSFDPYWNANTTRYYDTKSPYSNMHLVLGGNGRSITDIDYTRNIKPNWNFGFNYHGLYIDKQILRSGRGDRNVISHYYDLFTTFHSKDSAYWLFANFRRMSHFQLENGGVEVNANSVFADFFDEFAAPNLDGPESNDLRTNLHLFHQYRVVPGVEVYHVVDKYRQYLQFSDPQRTDDFYDTLLLIEDKLDKQYFRTLRNEVGLKGKVGNLFINGYWAARSYSMDYGWLDESDFSLKTKGTEYYVGGRMTYDLSKTMRVGAEAETLLQTNYKVKATFTSPWLNAAVSQYEYKPSFIQQLYLGAHDAWVKDFQNVTATQVQATGKYNWRFINFSAGGTITSLDNFIYFKEDTLRSNQKVLPRQSSSQHLIQLPEASIRLTFLKKITVYGRAIKSFIPQNPDQAIQMPEWFLHGQLAFQDKWINGNFDFQIGLEAHWQSGYYANGYDVPTQQFFTQETFRNNAFPLLDVFFNWKMKRGRIFFKYNNLVQAATKSGYMPTPYYPGQRNILDFGFDWLFFD